ncbi:MAG TPA: hypothetical protein VH414_05215 [Lichenihabitans sp.]|nr:hypothetical protein [Lichenihabitans sp.]
MQSDVANDNSRLTITERAFLLIIAMIGMVEVGAVVWLGSRLVGGLIGA